MLACTSICIAVAAALMIVAECRPSRATGPRLPYEQQLSFFSTSDTHFGYMLNDNVSAAELNIHTIREMHRTPGMRRELQPVPSHTVASEDVPQHVEIPVPEGVVITGDLINDGINPALCHQQWRQFQQTYGLAEGHGCLQFPVYEGFGNHDGGNTSAGPEECNVVRRQLRLRNLLRLPEPVSLSSNALHYSWDWGPLHLVHLNLYPGNAHEDVEAFEVGSWKSPEGSLAFLQQDLERHVGRSGRPVITMHHYGLDAWWSDTWWSDHEREMYYQVLSQYNVVGIIVGHTHSTDFYKWRGIDVYNSPAAQQERDHQPLPPSFLVFMFDWHKEMMVVAERLGDGWGTHSHVKSISVRPSAVV